VASLFATNCSGCHGITGQGTDRGRSLVGVAAEAPAATHVQSVTGGKGGMPPFGAFLPPEQIAALVDYVRSTF